MKLIAKTSLYYLFLSVPILIVSGIICYHIITKEVKKSNDELLINRKELLQNYIQENNTDLLQLIEQSKEAQIKKINSNIAATNIFSDTLIFDKNEKELAQNRLLTSYVTVNHENYQIKIWRSTLEFDELLEGIFTSLIILLLLLFMMYLIINFWISKLLWKPFYHTVAHVKNFRANDNTIPEFDKTSIVEFETLNASIQTMMSKMIVDYNSQKKFTENASHEIQTPLAVIKSKIDLLIQSENLTEKEVKLISSIDEATSKLIRLNKSLLLLTKIENKQFKFTEKISVEKTVNNSINLFDAFIENQKISIQQTTAHDFLINMNPDLCLILMDNLLQNAIRHNYPGGQINIHIDNNSLSICNTGQDKPLEIGVLFERFQKKSNLQESMGLGLSISHEIAEISGLALKYSFINEQHCFSLTSK